MRKNYKKFKQGVFKPKNKEKFLGKEAFFRSGLELKFMRFCDRNPNIIKWGSENVILPYISPFDNKIHKYYIDNFVVIKEGNTIKKYLIEIKPSKQTKPPSTKYKNERHFLYEKALFIKNQAKWAAADHFCKKNNLEFLILTEKDLI
jgi:hypothetical protein